MSSKFPVPFRFSGQNFVGIFISPTSSACRTHHILHYFITVKILGEAHHSGAKMALQNLADAQASAEKSRE
jgi:hypothetical protein